jgi:predicted ester cyclase
MSTQTNVDIVSRFAEELFEKFNGDAAGDLVSNDFHAHPWSVYGLPDGPEGVRQFAAVMRSAFSNAHRSVEDVIAEDDKVAMRYVFEADHTGPLMDIPPTGKRIRLPGIFIARVEDGKIAEYWREEDLMGLMQQLDSPEVSTV